MDNGTCSVEGCHRRARSRRSGICGTHYERLRRNGTLEAQRPRFHPRPKKHPDICTVEGCDLNSHLRGWCRQHYRRWLKAGDPGPADVTTYVSNTGKGCVVPNCDRPASAVEMCDVHYQRSRLRPDDLEAPIVPYGYKGEDVTYSGIHMRLKRERGNAADHLCVDCGDPAQDWSYNNRGEVERRDSKHGCPYSGDVMDYDPRCRSCHREYDRRCGVHRHFV